MILDMPHNVKARSALNDLRRQVDVLDNEMVSLLARRFILTDQIGEFKKANGLKAVDKERERLQRSTIEKLAADAGLDPAIAYRCWRCVIKEVVKTHMRR